MKAAQKQLLSFVLVLLLCLSLCVPALAANTKGDKEIITSDNLTITLSKPIADVQTFSYRETPGMGEDPVYHTETVYRVPLGTTITLPEGYSFSETSYIQDEGEWGVDGGGVGAGPSAERVSVMIDGEDWLPYIWGMTVLKYNYTSWEESDGTPPEEFDTVYFAFVNRTPDDSPFTDVKNTNRFYFNPVLWAYENDITAGTTATTFSPDADCTRAQVVTFLWRALGSPEPTAAECPFVDVKAGSFYYKAMLWAAENGVTNGMDATHFAPDATVTRGQFVTFLWRALESPEPDDMESMFTDVSAGSFYYKAVLWATEWGVTNGMSETEFAPNGPCTRGQVVTFLFRA